MNTITTIFFAVIIGIILGMLFPVFWFDVFTRPFIPIVSGIGTIILSFTFVFGGVSGDKWEANKHLFNYKKLLGNIYLCSQSLSSGRLFFLMRLKISS